MTPPEFRRIAAELATGLLAMADARREEELQLLRRDNPTLYALVRSALGQLREIAASGCETTAPVQPTAEPAEPQETTETEQAESEPEQPADTAYDKARRGDKNYGISFNLEAGGDMYAPSRDFAYNYPQMIKMVINCFSQEYWPELLRLFYDYCRMTGCWPRGQDGMSQEEQDDAAFDLLESAKDCYCKFLNIAATADQTGCEAALQSSGWLDVHPAAQATWLAMLGQVVTGQLFQGIRDLRREPGTPAAEIADLLLAGTKVRQAMNKIDGTAESWRIVARNFRQEVRLAREAGLDFNQISELVDDVRFGRVSHDE